MKIEHIQSRVSIGSTGHPALRCADCEGMICDDVLGKTPWDLDSMAQEHRCDEVEQVKYLLQKAEYEANWRRGKDGQ